MNAQPDWLNWARKMQALAQTGLTYAENAYDRERYRELHELAIEIFAEHSRESPAVIEQWFAIQPGYATPKVDVRGACFRDGQILLVREKSDGRWCLPGGWADVGDIPSKAAEREVGEEAGFVCVARKVIGVFDANRTTDGRALPAFHAFKIIFLCEITGGAPKPDHEIVEVNFFSRDELPPLSENRTPAAAITECFEHADNPMRPTTFD